MSLEPNRPSSQWARSTSCSTMSQICTLVKFLPSYCVDSALAGTRRNAAGGIEISNNCFASKARRDSKMDASFLDLRPYILSMLKLTRVYGMCLRSVRFESHSSFPRAASLHNVPATACRLLPIDDMMATSRHIILASLHAAMLLTRFSPTPLSSRQHHTPPSHWQRSSQHLPLPTHFSDPSSQPSRCHEQPCCCFHFSSPEGHSPSPRPP